MPSDEFHRVIDRVRTSAKRAKALQEFEGVDRQALADMTDKELAEWQCEFEANTPQAILADHEWQRRLTAKQVGAMRFAAWLSIAGVVIGAFLGFGLSSLSTSMADEKAKQPIASECSPGASTQVLRPVEKPERPAAAGVAPQQPPHAANGK